ncbi:hypothetical protein VNO78_00908 [Psophocarpus tetragonolobus]|uniref:Uncharacterized protein n=1 Tax=Psophocarpus tetragonolobus TaxID=3891 RepID=A0AAN9XUE5_PSOTE
MKYYRLRLFNSEGLQNFFVVCYVSKQHCFLFLLLKLCWFCPNDSLLLLAALYVTIFLVVLVYAILVCNIVCLVNMLAKILRKFAIGGSITC